MWFLSKSFVIISFGLEQLLVVWLAVHASMERGVVAKAVFFKESGQVKTEENKKAKNAFAV